jgi:hypothetical protein
MSKKFTFSLAVDTHLIDNQLGCVPVSKIANILPKNSTKVDDLIPGNSFVSFLDPSKKSKRWMITMKDSMSKTLLPPKTDLKCWWCHHTFDSSPIGCPIQAVNAVKNGKTYYSLANKRDIEIREEDSKKEECFLTIGVFCGWGCMLGYAESKRTDLTYRESIQLAYQICPTEGIHPAPPFTVLKDYGGPLSYEEFKNKYNTERFVNTKNHYIRMVPVGEIYDAISKF